MFSMSIKDFYYKLSDVSLNISFFFTMFAIIATFLINYQPKPPLLSTILLGFSFFYYMVHLFYIKKAIHVPYDRKSIHKDQRSNVFLLEKATSRDFYLFQPTGISNIKIKLRQTWKGPVLILIEQGTELKMQLKKGRRGTIVFSLNNNQIYGMIFTKDCKNIVGEIYFPNYSLFIQRQANNRLIFMKENRQVAMKIKGWLPLEWTSRFRLNIPVITFQERLTWEEKMVIVLAMTCIEEKIRLI